MNLIEELIEDLSKDVDITKVLFRAKVLAHRLKIPDLSRWISHELDGYPNGESLPNYRVTICRLMGTVSDGYHIYNNYTIPIPGTDHEAIQEMLTIRLTQSIATFERDLGGESNKMRVELPAQFYQWLSESFSGDYVVQQAFREIDKAQVVNIITSVKSKLLDFLLQISDTITDDKPVSQNKSNEISEMFNNTVITAEVVNINTGSGSQKNKTKIVKKGNFKSVAEELRKNGLDEMSISELELIIKTDTPDEVNKVAGKGVKEWTKKVMGYAIDGSWKITLSIAGKIIGGALAAYYGWPS